MVVLNRDSWGNVRDGIFVMCYSELSKLAVWESCIGSVTNPWLTKVDHGCRNAVFYESHCLKGSKGGTKTVTSCLDSVSRELSLKAADFGENIIVNWSDSLLETSVNIAVALRPLDICIMGRIKISYPVIDWFWTSIRNIDRLIRRQVSNKTLNIIQDILNDLSGNKTDCGSFINVVNILSFAAVSILTQLKWDLGLSISVLVITKSTS